MFYERTVSPRGIVYVWLLQINYTQVLNGLSSQWTTGLCGGAFGGDGSLIYPHLEDNIVEDDSTIKASKHQRQSDETQRKDNKRCVILCLSQNRNFKPASESVDSTEWSSIPLKWKQRYIIN